jgi:hypothetical protein
MLAAILCREFGWTYNEYMDQPYDFILTIVSMMEEEAKRSKKQ